MQGNSSSNADADMRQQAEHLADVLSQHPDFRVLRRLTLEPFLADVSDGVRIAIVDTETTGTEPDKDAVIELGVLIVEVDPVTGQVGRVVEQYSALEDPGFPIPPASTEIHGITDAMVSGCSFDDHAVQALFEGVHLVLAHNAAFDRAFLEKRFDFMQTLPFGCTYRDIDWKAERCSASALEFLVYRLGYFYDGHRAVHDCEALLARLAVPLPVSGRMPMQVLFERANQPEFVIHALRSPIESKDLLKAKGFRWFPEDRVWKISVAGELQGREVIEWLKREVYRCKPEEPVLLGFDKRSARQRFSIQTVKTTIKSV